MTYDTLIQTALAIVIIFSRKNNLREFEILLYEQAARFLESNLKDFREHEELGNYTK